MKAILFLMSLFPLFSFANCPIPELEDSFILNERFVSLTTTLDLESEEGDFGTITERLISLTRSFTYTGPSGETIATARQRLVSWGVQIDVHDCSGTHIGTIKENVIESLWKVTTTYAIENASGEVVAESNKVDILATSFTLRSPQGRVIARMNRPMINLFGDNWNVEILDHNQVDPRLYIMIGAYKTSADNQRSE